MPASIKTVGMCAIAESIHISPEATPIWNIYANVRDGGGHVAGIWTENQVKSWRWVASAVHNKGGRISCQLLHTGRIAQPGIGDHPLVKGSGAPLPPVSSSATALKADLRPGDYSWDQYAALPRALEAHEISRVVDDYRIAARNAHRANFDFVEIHAAHGYLMEQFFCDGINVRTDQYGGSLENRCRLFFETITALINDLGDNRVAVRLSPTSADPITGESYQTYFGAISSDADQLYHYLIKRLNAYPLAYLLLTEPRIGVLSVGHTKDGSHTQPLRNGRFRDLYSGTLVGAGGFTPKTAEQAVTNGVYDMIAFGRWFLANPDLPNRLRIGAPLNVYDRNTFYGGNLTGYTDYPDLQSVGSTAYGNYPLIDQSEIGQSLKKTKISSR